MHHVLVRTKLFSRLLRVQSVLLQRLSRQSLSGFQKCLLVFAESPGILVDVAKEMLSEPDPVVNGLQ